MNQPIYEIPMVDSGSLRPRNRSGEDAGAAPSYHASMLDPAQEQPEVPAPFAAPAAVPVRDTAAAVPALNFENAPDMVLAPDSADPDLIAALGEVLRSNASDLHLTSNAPPMLRVDGGLRPVDGAVVWGTARVRAALYSLLSDPQKEVFERDLELDFAYTVTENARFRVNFYQQRGAIGAAFRIIPTDIKTLKDLGVPDTVAAFSKLARGLVLVTGPTGSGKSTTLAALIDLVNRTRADHIVTVEDPIEFLHNNQKSLVNQREVGGDTHSFAAALKHVLRQDPDVILVGELRDLETISVALTAAETGHLVFATLHTQDAAQTIDRVIDVFPPHQQDQVRAQLAATLRGVVCQTLVKRATGKGRVVATEVLVTTPAIANLIREGKTYQIASSMQAGRELGMYTMDQHLAELVDEGKIAYASGVEKAHDVEGFRRLVHRDDPGAGSHTHNMSSAGLDFGDTFSMGRS
ncbi:type IV pilus twitching motility protein PilT [Marisediminicola antarctica]|uniref:type IV pilus twitching motility protein PilT n=1 Tax=Marisediminicola antarctica TaxID=674079 RepID=UPI0022B27B08|nr:type IV pilus twitching motility protein PilT [Marisediminicola antarctica]